MRQQSAKFSRLSVPPLERGVVWSTSKATLEMISGALQYSQMRLALAATIEYLECMMADLGVLIAML